MLAILSLLALLSASFVQSAVSQSDANAGNTRKVITKVMPSYPPLARTMQLSGSVKLEVVVGANGSAKAVRVRGGSPVFAQSAQDAVRQWKWQKAEHDTTELEEVKFSPAL